jgi:hypothetical protein
MEKVYYVFFIMFTLLDMTIACVHDDWLKWGVVSGSRFILCVSKTMVLFCCFILISWGCRTSPTLLHLCFFFFCNEPIWLAHRKKKLKLWRLPKIEDSMEWWSASPPLAHLYRWERQDFGQNVWD